MTGQQDACGNHESVTLSVFGGNAAKTVSSSCLNEKVAMMCISRRDSVQGYKKGHANNSICITSGRQEGDTQQSKTGAVQVAEKISI